EEAFERDVLLSTQMTKHLYEQRSLGIKFKESISRLLSPIIRRVCMEKKPCVNSKTVKTALILPPDANQYGTLFGGSLMAHIDDVAAIAAVKHARKPVVTASTDSVDFLSPVKVGDSIQVEGF